MAALTQNAAWLVPPKYPVNKLPSTNGTLVWHYTTGAGLEGIIKSDTIWATSTDSLNDTGEGVFGAHDFRELWQMYRTNAVAEAPVREMDAWVDEAVERIRDRDTFVICVCNSGDSLVHWRSYTEGPGNAGYAIAFRRNGEMRALAPAGSDQLFNPDFSPVLTWTDVVYGSHSDFGNDGYWDPYRRLIEQATSTWAAIRDQRIADRQGALDMLDRALTIALMTTKHQAYESENEARLVLISPSDYPWVRTGAFGKQSVVTVTADGTNDIRSYSTPSPTKLPVAEVVLGPWNPAADEDRISNLLNQAGYSVEVRRSSIPIH
jgi:hypothetical protein